MSPGKKIILSLIIFSLAALFIIISAIYPLFNGVKRKSEESISQKRTFLESQIEIENLKNVQALYKTYQQNLGKIDALLIDPEIPLDFIEFLEKTAEGLGLWIEISPGSFQKSKTETWPFINFQITLTGSFFSFSRFLEKLELGSFPAASRERGFLVQVSSLGVKKIAEKDIRLKKLEKFTSEDVNATLSVKVYAYEIKR